MNVLSWWIIVPKPRDDECFDSMNILGRWIICVDELSQALAREREQSLKQRASLPREWMFWVDEGYEFVLMENFALEHSHNVAEH